MLFLFHAKYPDGFDKTVSIAITRKDISRLTRNKPAVCKIRIEPHVKRNVGQFAVFRWKIISEWRPGGKRRYSLVWKLWRPYVPMALTLFPTEICLKFASVPGPEAHKYVILPISCSLVAPFAIFSPGTFRFRLLPRADPRRRVWWLLQPLTCFCGTVAHGDIQGEAR